MDVLIIDDNPRVCTSLAKILRVAGLLVDTADNGLAAFAELLEHPYRVIVCDIQMPFMNGIKLFEELEAEYPDLARRMVFISAWSEEPVVRQFLERSGQPYLEKPFEAADFVKLVRQVAAGRV